MSYSFIRSFHSFIIQVTYSYFSSKNVFIFFENTEYDKEGSLRFDSSDSHSLGPAYLSDRSPNLELTKGNKNCVRLG